jgi:tetratricopeptide (TPR) repeat protein
MPRTRFTSRFFLLALFCASHVSSATAARNPEPKWIRVSSAHFSVLTDGGDKKGREANLRLEQMRAIFAQLFMKTKLQLPEPLDVIALKSDEEYIRVAPLRQGRPISAPGFFLPGEDRNYIVLDLFADGSWRAVSREFARLLLNFNYPPTQDWFDEGFAQYFSSLQLDDAQARIGGDPTQNLPWEHSLPGQPSADPNSHSSFVDLLSRQWVPIPELFSMRRGASGYPPMFYAQSWIVMNYLLNQNRLSDAGTYIGLVKLQKAPVEQAVQRAFGMTVTQLEEAVKDYFHSFVSSPQASESAKSPGAAGSATPSHQFSAPLGPGDIGSSVQDVTDAQAQALLAEMSVRLPEHRDQGEKDLRTVISDAKTDSAIAHRALAWVHMERKEFDRATEELARAAQLDARDAWTRYYLALVKFRASLSNRSPIEGVSNMIQDLIAVLDWNPEFAEAHNMLAMARLQGGGIHSALESIRLAIQFSPRNEQYLLNMAQIDLAGKKWDDATTLLDRLKGSSNPQISQTASKSLEDLPTLKKYGVLPQPSASSQLPQAGSTNSTQTASQSSSTEAGENVNPDQSEAAPPEPALDRRKSQFFRGRLLSVDCSQSPVAILTVRAASRTIRLRTDNYKTLLNIGTEEFSCDWTNRAIVVNYKAGGKADGDLVSVEVQ